MGGFFSKLFKVGELPPELAAAAQQSPLFVADGLTFKASGQMRTPGRMTSGFSARHGGAVVILPDRVLTSFARYVVLDDRPGAPPPDPSTQCVIDGAGIRIAIDIARVIPGGTGQVDIEYPLAIPHQVLGALPTNQWAGRVAAADPQLMLQRI